MVMREKHSATTLASIMRLDETMRNYIAVAIWFIVLIYLVFSNALGLSILVTAAFMFQLSGAYSTFLFCGKPKYGRLVHATPYALALAGAVFFVASGYRNPVEVSLIFLVLIAIMHWSIVSDRGRDAVETATTPCVTEYAA
jgi:hypothetical protein